MDDGKYISLAEAWRRFVEARYSSLLASERHKPSAPGGRFDLMLDRKTGAWKREPILGAETGDCIRWHEANMAEGNFRDSVARECEAYCVSDSGAPSAPIAFEDWWWGCAAGRTLWRQVEIHGPARCDGGSRSWLTLEPAASFPIAIYFDRQEFEKLEIVKWWSEAATASPVEELPACIGNSNEATRTPAKDGDVKQGRRPYRSEKGILAQKLIDEAFPSGVDANKFAPAEFIREVCKTDGYKMAEKQKIKPSNDTLLRRAGLRCK